MLSLLEFGIILVTVHGWTNVPVIVQQYQLFRAGVRDVRLHDDTLVLLTTSWERVNEDHLYVCALNLARSLRWDYPNATEQRVLEHWAQQHMPAYTWPVSSVTLCR